jgi:bifunctional N-acetylglucosamine-1-phosphate-uridyltransferase/glucosamine-1-phosphate-acetyltransferase GlmU-like protein
MIISVLPAAGMGRRLNQPIPKLFVKLDDGLRVINLLEATISNLVDECCFVIRPDMVPDFNSFSTGKNSTFVIQESPRGMGDAIFCASAKFEKYKTLVVIWGDQVGINQETLSAVLKNHEKSEAYCSIPLTSTEFPYVHYAIDDSSRLIDILQRREGNEMPSEGLADIGVFVINTFNLEFFWNDYLETSLVLGETTKEINFLPFLIYLARKGLSMNFPKVQDSDEALGLNTNEDLTKVRDYLLKKGSK